MSEDLPSRFRAGSDCFAGDSDLAVLMRAKDWSATPLGSPDQWPHSLRTIVRVLLTSRFAMWLGWGDDLTFLYNDAYRDMTLAAKHPWALGRPSREVWAEIWPEIGPRIERVLQTGEATWDEDLLLFLERRGYPEETYHTFSYSPVTDDHGTVCGHLCVVTEQTDRVIAERRMAVLRDVAAGIASTSGEAELFAALERSLSGSKDLPFTLTYLLDESGTRARRACRTGIADTHPAAPEEIDCTNAMWPFDVDGSGALVELDRLPQALPDGPWHRPPTKALVLPIAQQGQKRVAGVLVAGVNPFRPVDDTLRSFASLLVGEIGAGLSNARAYEEERRRVEMLAEVDRAKTIFFSNVSHEFRTPLTLLLGPIDDIRRIADQLPREVRDQLDVVHRNGQRLLKLVNTLLEFSRIEAGRVQARFEPVDLSSYTAELASTFRSAMERAGLSFHVSCPPLDEPVYVDRDMWEKIVLNLLSNALKFTLEGSVTVSVASRELRAVLEVEDTGAGIPSHELSRVFDRFHRVEGMKGRSHEGSGIGLALVHELVKLHGGEIGAQSVVGAGTRFTVAIPFGAAHLRSEHIVPGGTAPLVPHAAVPFVEEALLWLPHAVGTHAEDESPYRDARRDVAALPRILLADDNADMREYARRLLAERWQVQVVGDGRAALEAARKHRPDVIVTDVMMPHLDGFGLLRELRSDADLCAIPVIMLSARAGEEARLEGLSATADDYLVKPFSARDLLARVDAQIMKAQARAFERRHAARMLNVFRHAPVAIAVLQGPDHVFELANPRCEDLVGRHDLVGRPIREALPELTQEGIFDVLDRIRSSGEAFIGQGIRVAMNRDLASAADERHFDLVCQPLVDDAGRVDTIVVIAHDVTALMAAKHEAQTANRLKDEFLATLSHELRTPLNAVLGYTQMVRGGMIAADRLPSVLETIERNARLQEQLISDVLDVSRIITGKLRLDVRPVNLARVIEEALETVSPAAAAKGVKLQSALDQPGVPVAGDGQRLQQVIWNLLSNAIKFTSRGGRVQIRLQRVNSLVEIAVSDTGEGIAPEFLPHLFQRFSQADGAFTRAHGGLGLGLAISRHLVEAHGGRIEAFSPGKGRGTTIRVELPLMIVHDDGLESADRVHPRSESMAPPHLQLVDLSGHRVLLVDDDADALQMASDVLSLAGADVVTAMSAQEALGALDRATFDAAILDIGMAGVDGYELLRRIRQRPRSAQGDIPAAALTAYARTMDRTRSLQAGFQMHLAKPVQPNELTAAVFALTGHARIEHRPDHGASAISNSLRDE